jgi:hypothetical protein
MLQEVADRLDLVRPSVLTGSNADEQGKQLLACANEEGREAARRGAWQALTKEQTFTTTAAETQSGAIPSDFDRIIQGTAYNRTKARPLTGPLTAIEYQDYKGRLTSFVYEAFRIRGDAFLIVPAPPAGETVAFEYISKWWCGAAADTAPTQATIAADTDIVFLDEELFRLGTMWRYLRRRGLDYAEGMQQYEMLLAQLLGRDAGARPIYMGGNQPFRPRAPLPPDGNWNL